MVQVLVWPRRPNNVCSISTLSTHVSINDSYQCASVKCSIHNQGLLGCNLSSSQFKVQWNKESRYWLLMIKMVTPMAMTMLALVIRMTYWSIAEWFVGDPSVKDFAKMQPHHDPYHACRSVIIIVIHIHCHHLVRSARTSLEYFRYPPENCNKSFFLPTPHPPTPSGCTVLSKHCQAMYVNAVCCLTSLFPSVQLISCDSKLLFSYQTKQHQFDVDADDNDDDDNDEGRSG